MPDTITAKRLREQRAAIIEKARTEYIDKPEKEGRQPTADEVREWEKLMGSGREIQPEKKDQLGNVIQERKIDHGEEGRLLERIQQLERQENLETELRATPKPTDTPVPGDVRIPGDTTSLKGRKARRAEEMRVYEDRHIAFQAWAAHNWHQREGRELSTRQEEALKRFKGFKAHQQAVSIPLVRSYHYAGARRQMLKKGEIKERMIEESRQEMITYREQESRAGASSPQSILVGTAGAYTIPEGFVNNLEVALLQYGGIRMVADVMRTASGQDLPWPTVNDTTVKGQRINENTQVPTKDISFGALVFHAYKYTSGIVLVPVELMEDSAFNMAAVIGNLLGIRIGRILADEFTNTGAGAAPVGIVTAATLGQTAASPTAIAGDDLYNLKHSVDPAYRTGPGVGWMFHDQILLAIKKLKDGLGRYLWQASLAGSSPDTLDGDPITINQSMVSTIASTNKTVLYGMLSKYKIRDVAEVRLRRLVERFADQDQEAFLMFSRHDGNLMDAGTHPVKFLQH